MKNEKDFPTRRSLLEQAVGAVGIVSVLAQAQGGRGGPRVRDSFDFGWKFFKGDAPGAQQPDFADASWKDVDLPHDCSIEGPFSENAPARGQGGFLPTGIGWYRKHFNVPESYSGRKVVHRVRRRLSAQRGVDQRSVPGQTAVRLHRFFLRSQSPPEIRRR